MAKICAISANLIGILLIAALTVAIVPRTVAAPALTISIAPTTGVVGTVVDVDGTIDTPNGNYTVRWDGTLNITTGQATEYNVTTSFIVPQTVGAPSGRDVLVELIDDQKTGDNVANTTFRLYTKFYVEAAVPSLPSQLQEGNTTRILVNVTGGATNTVYSPNVTVTTPSGAVYSDTLLLTDTTNTGYGEGNTTYPEAFSTDANTDFVGRYTITVNETLATGNFTVGLTDRLEYSRGDTASIRGSGYVASENVTVNVIIGEVSASEYPKNVTANAQGMIIDSWTIPDNAKPGIYTVRLTNATSSTPKAPADSQNFTVLGAVCEIQTWNRADPPKLVTGVTVEVTEGTTDTLLEAGTTDKNGLTEFWLESGNYTFEAFFLVEKNFVFVGRLQNQSIPETGRYEFNLTCQLSDITITVHDEDRNPLPFIDLALNYTYTARGNQTIQRVLHLETNDTGTIVRFNTIANISYEIEARRYGHLFNRTFIENLTTPLQVDVTCPTYRMIVNALDSQDLPIQNVDVHLVEWGSEILVDRQTTDTSGTVAFSHTFGRYRVRVYNSSTLAENSVLLNETIIDLIEDEFSVVIECRIFNLDLSFSAIDYFGKPIPNAVIEIKRDGAELASLTTARDGTVSAEEMIGGTLHFSVYILGELGEARTLYLDGDKEILFKMNRYIVVGGYPLEAIQFVALVSFVVFVVIIAAVLIQRGFSTMWLQRNKGSATSKEKS
jgi:hypothetical protein